MNYGTEKLLNKDQEVLLTIEGKAYKGIVKKVSMMNFEREYLVQFPETGEVLWLNNSKVRLFSLPS